MSNGIKLQNAFHNNILYTLTSRIVLGDILLDPKLKNMYFRMKEYLFLFEGIERTEDSHLCFKM